MSFNKEPHWIVSKYPGKDRHGNQYRKGERVFYYPSARTIVAGEHAKRAAEECEEAAYRAEMRERLTIERENATGP